MLFKGSGDMAIITSRINTYVYIEVLDNFLVLSIENWFGDGEVTFQDDNVSGNRAKKIKTFLRERHIKSILQAS